MLCYRSRLDWRLGAVCPRAGRTSGIVRRGQAIARDLRVNQMIRVPQVRVVDEEGAQLGVMPTPQALAMAQERGLDLVEVAPMASPPVVKFLDFGQYKYELTKREKEAKRRQRSVTFKEVRLSPKIGTGDFDTKVHRAIEFLEDGDRIKVTVRFRGRELTHPELGRNMLTRFTDRIKDHGVAERAPLLEGKSMHLTVASLHKPKEHEAPLKPGRTAEVGAAEKAAPAAAPAEKAAPARAAATTNGAEPSTAEPSPAAESSEPQATKPAGKPAEKPATKPAEKPAAAATRQQTAADAPPPTTKTEPPPSQAPAATGE
ncbi:MAG TPA: translation initiation factor IF-3 [Candidatus Limnocylindrales bacterium]|nr:translation initiation factor IF-3 [Candidatus Limnocylindrales bacterium]